MWHGGAFVDIATAAPRLIGEIRRHTIGSVTQFLRAIPRVPTLDIVAEPLIERGVDPARAKARAGGLLSRLAIPQTALAPAAGHLLRRRAAAGQYRPRLCRHFADPAARRANGFARSGQPGPRLEMIDEARAQGTAIIGIFHDAAARQQVATRTFELAGSGP